MKAVREKHESGFAFQAVASIARKLAQNNASAACFAFVHQPKEPPNMEVRLKAIKSKKS